jgi:hypothetical protein
MCRMLNLNTNSINNSREIIWSNKRTKNGGMLKTTISESEKVTIEAPTGIDTIISNTNSKNTEYESNNSD